jgi:hypothetical protein
MLPFKILLLTLQKNTTNSTLLQEKHLAEALPWSFKYLLLLLSSYLLPHSRGSMKFIAGGDIHVYMNNVLFCRRYFTDIKFKLGKLP